MNKQTVKTLIIALASFASGTALGSFITKKVVAEKYRDEANERAQKEIDHAFERLERAENTWQKETEHIDIPKEEPEQEIIPDVKEVAKQEAEILKCNDLIKKCDYNKCFEPEETVVEPAKKIFDKPYIIPPRESEDYEDYETITLNWYQDGVMTDSEDEEVDDWQEAIGEDSIEHFGDYEDDRIFVRNDRRKCVYEVIFVNEDYND